MIADLSREKLTLQRSQDSVLLYGCSCLSAINEASLLKTTVANPPVVEKNNVSTHLHVFYTMRA